MLAGAHRVARVRWWLAALVALCGAPALARASEPAGRPAVRTAKRIFDLSAAERFGGLGISRTFGRETHRRQYRPGFELRGTDVLRWTRGAAVVEGWFGASVRWGPRLLSGSLLQNGGMAGLRWGPLDLKAGVSTALLNLSRRAGDLDFGLFSPRASLGVGVNLGSARIEAQGHVEYAWGWLGPDEYVRSVGLLVSMRRAPVGPTFRTEPAATER
ncbi:MAG: hypothetical protein RL685_3120 [Pseudomonadota bacterium]